MPNHVTSIIEAPKDVLDFLRADELVDELSFGRDPVCDLGRVIPMPHWSHPMFTAEQHEHRNDNGDLVGIGYSLGGFSPLDWARDWWGTKWNAYDVKREGDAVLRFDTAWSHPEPVLLVLSHLFPEATIRVKYADEDLGYNFGEYAIANGEVAAAVLPDPGTDEACDFAARLKYGKSYADLKKEWGEDD